MIRSFRGVTPRIGENSYIDESAVVIGDVEMGDNCSVWPLTVIRADINKIRIGNNTNIQDGSVLHVTHQGPFSPDGAELHIGDQVTVGHKVLLHGCRIGNQCLIGMGSIVMNGAKIGRNSIVGAGSVITEGKEFPERSLIIGSPARIIRTLDDGQVQKMGSAARFYVANGPRYTKGLKRIG